MNNEKFRNIIPSHKILVVTKHPLTSFASLFLSLKSQGIESTSIQATDLSSTLPTFHTQFVWIYSPFLSNSVINSVLASIPELTGVLFFFDNKSSNLEILQAIAMTRTHFLAIIGAVFLIDSNSQENTGVEICRRSGIPYLFTATLDDKEDVYHVSSSTISSLVELTR